MHISYPTPSNKDLDVGSDHKVFTKTFISKMNGYDLLEAKDIAYFWAFQHGNSKRYVSWKPVYKNIVDEIVMRCNTFIR